MTRSGYLGLFIFSIFLIRSEAQVDLTKYSSSDLFQAKRIIDDSDFSNKEEATESDFLELELIEINKHWQSGEYEEAIDNIERLMVSIPDYPYLPFLAGLISFEQDELDLAKDYLLESLEMDPLFLYAKYYIGLIELDLGNKKESKTIFNQLIEIHEFKSLGHFGRGIQGLEIGDPKQAYAHFQKSTKLDSTFIEVYLPLIELDIYFGNTNRALKRIEKAVSIFPTWEEGIMARGLLSLYIKSDIDQFEADLDLLIKLAPSNYHYLSMKGFLEMELGNYQNAVNNFINAYDLELDTMQTGEFRFNTRFKKNETIVHAINYYKETSKISYEARPYVNRAICAFVNDEVNKSISLLDSAIHFEESALIYTLKGSFLKNKWNQEHQAIDALSKAVELDSSNWVGFYFRGGLYTARDSFLLALNDYSKVVTLKPRRKEGYKYRGIMNLKMGKYAKAYKDFSYAIAIDPTDNDIYFDRALSSLNLGYETQSEIDLKKITKANQEGHKYRLLDQVYYLLHEIELSRKDSIRALNHLDSASMYSKHIQYHEHLLTFSKSMNEKETELKALDRLVRKNPKKYLIKRAEYHFQNSNFETAVQDSRRYLRYQKKSGEALFYLGKSLIKLGNEKEGERILQRSKKFDFNVSEN